MKTLTFFTVLLLLINTIVSFLLSKSIAYVLGNVYAIPILFMSIFYIFKDSRNIKSMIKILFYSSVVIFISLIGNIFTIIQNIRM